jgi:acetyl-CoA synthetase
MTYIWKPPREVIEESNVKEYLDKKNYKSYKDFVKYSCENIRKFWSEIIEPLNIEFFEDYKEVLDISKGVEWARWFIGGKVNVTYNALDRHKTDKTAFIWYGENGEVKKVSYFELKDKVARLAGYFKEIGIKKGDVIATYLPMIPETIITLFATLKVGAIFAPIFSGFSPSAVAQRLSDAEPKLLVTCDGYYRRGKIIELKKMSDEAVKLSNLNIKRLIVRRIGLEISLDENDQYFDEALKSERFEEHEQTNAEDPALLLYTSGTTGKPKGSIITHIGALLQPTKEIYFNMDLKENGTLFWITDIGWMMGPWQIIGSQTLHATHVIFEGAIDYPEQDRIWRIIEDSHVTAFGFAATVARILKRYGSKIAKNRDLSSIRTFGNTGEPIDPDTWLWIMKDIGEEKRPFINLSGGTEIFGCFLLPSPVVELKPSTLWGPGLGMDVDVFDDEGNPVRGKVGYLVCKKPAPSMTKGFWKDEKRYIETYWSKYPSIWYHGDLALIDEDGFWYLLGRADDTIKVAGKRIGPAEIEGAINNHYAVSESACIGIPHELKGEEIACFVVLKKGYEDYKKIENEIREKVIKEIGKSFEPSRIYFVKDLPKTRSGKIMRRIIRNVFLNKELGEISVLENPDSIEEIRKVISQTFP